MLVFKSINKASSSFESLMHLRNMLATSCSSVPIEHAGLTNKFTKPLYFRLLSCLLGTSKLKELSRFDLIHDRASPHVSISEVKDYSQLSDCLLGESRLNLLLAADGQLFCRARSSHGQENVQGGLHHTCSQPSNFQHPGHHPAYPYL